MMRRRRRPSARWSYADSGSLAIQPNAGANVISSLWLLPPARVSFMLSQRGRGNSLVFAGCHLWLDFYWKNEAAALGLPDVDFGVIKTTIADPTTFAPDLSLADAQWDQPSTPATLTSWDEDDDSGVDSWLWQHHIKGFSPPNAVVQTESGSTPGIGNQQNIIAAGSVDAPVYVCRKFHVTQEWQPDVVIRSKRRLQKDEGILLYMQGAPTGSQECICNVHLRTLTK